LDCVPNPIILKNFFEPINAGGQILRTDDGYGMTFSYNNITTNRTNTPIISIDPQYGYLFSGNSYYIGTDTVSPFELLTNRYHISYDTRVTFSENNYSFNNITDNLAMTRYEPINKRMYKYNNTQGQLNQAVDESFPYEVNPVSKNWSLHTSSGYLDLINFPTETTDLNLLVNITGTPSTPSANIITVYWGGVDVSGNVNLSFDNASLVETKSFTIRRPTAVMPGATLRFRMWDLSTNTYIDGIEVVPVNYLLGTAAPTSNIYKFNVGDIVYNTANDNVLGWKCTVAGSPGTWKYMQVTLGP
jgi:hypothetical protein